MFFLEIMKEEPDTLTPPPSVLFDIHMSLYNILDNSKILSTSTSTYITGILTSVISLNSLNSELIKEKQKNLTLFLYEISLQKRWYNCDVQDSVVYVVVLI